MNTNKDKLDKLMNAYFDRRQEAFTYKEPEHKRNYLGFSSAIAAVLVLLVCVGFAAHSHLYPTNSVFSASASNTTADESYAHNNYDKEGNLHPEGAGVMAVISFTGDDIVHVKVRSLSGSGTFCRLLPEAYDSYKLNPTVEIPAETSVKYLLSEAEGYYKWNPEKDWTSTLNAGYCNPEKADDKIEVVIYFGDGTFTVRYIDVTIDESKPIEDELVLTLVEQPE